MDEPRQLKPVTVTNRDGSTRTFQPTKERDPTSPAAMNRLVRGMYAEAFDSLGGMAWLVSFVRRSDENARCFVTQMTKTMLQPQMPGSVDGSLIVKVVLATGEEIEITKQGTRAPE